MNEERIPSKKSEIKIFIKNRLLPFYIHHRNLINKGLSEINLVRYIIMTVAGALVIIKLSGDISPNMFRMLAIVFGISLIAGCWLLGKFWDIVKGFDTERSWDNLRNPFTNQVLEGLKKRRDEEGVREKEDA